MPVKNALQEQVPHLQACILFFKLPPSFMAFVYFLYVPLKLVVQQLNLVPFYGDLPPSFCLPSPDVLVLDV